MSEYDKSQLDADHEVEMFESDMDQRIAIVRDHELQAWLQIYTDDGSGGMTLGQSIALTPLVRAALSRWFRLHPYG